MKNLTIYILLFAVLIFPKHLLSDDYKDDTRVVVMFGDSITMGGKWEKLFNPSLIANEGLKSDMTKGFLARMGDVYRHQPEIVFIMGGINDIAGGITPSEIFTNFKLIVQKLRRRGIIPVIQATLYSRRKGFNDSVEKLNILLVDYALKYDIDYIDLNTRLSSNKRLKKKYTFDGLHIKPRAYLIWKKEIEKILLKYNVTEYQIAGRTLKKNNPMEN